MSILMIYHENCGTTTFFPIHFLRDMLVYHFVVQRYPRMRINAIMHLSHVNHYSYSRLN